MVRTHTHTKIIHIGQKKGQFIQMWNVQGRSDYEDESNQKSLR